MKKYDRNKKDYTLRRETFVVSTEACTDIHRTCEISITTQYPFPEITLNAFSLVTAGTPCVL